MRNIKIVDTVSQYKKIKTKIDRSIQNVLKTGMYINGPEVKNFEFELAILFSRNFLEILIFLITFLSNDSFRFLLIIKHISLNEILISFKM